MNAREPTAPTPRSVAGRRRWRSRQTSQARRVGEMFARAAHERAGPVDVLVNNAGVQAPFSPLEMPLEEWDRVLPNLILLRT